MGTEARLFCRIGDFRIRNGLLQNKTVGKQPFSILKRGLDTLAVTSENLWGADGTPVEQGRKTNGNAARESVALS